MRLRSLSFGGSLLLGLLVTSSALAAGPKDKSNSQFSLHRDEQGDSSADTARARARAGDCKGAVDAFDQAIKVSIDPTLRRDRGLCFEKLTDPFPAMEDYRAYLAARPNATDAEQIRQRLFSLESANQVEGSGPPEPAAQADTQPTTQGRTTREYDSMMASEHLAQEADYSPLRKGTGLILGAYFGLRDLAIPTVNGTTTVGPNGGGTTNASLGTHSVLGYAIGGTLRASVTSNISLVGELGYVAYGTTGEDDKAGGLGALFGMELRVPLSKTASDQFIGGVGIGYERYTADTSKITTNSFPLRLQLGYRHVFGPSFALALVADGGLSYLTLSNLPINVGVPADTIAPFIGGQFAALVAF